MLDRRWIASRIPHRGTMCLLDEVLQWSTEGISCRTGSHRAPDNPLRARDGIGIACGIEYAAQAMALHGALTAVDRPGAPAAGFLAGIRGVRFHVLRLDDVPEDLLCDAVRVAGDGGSAIYEFEIRGGAKRLLHGRATVVLDAGERLKT